MDKRKPFCRAFACVHCSREPAQSYGGIFYRRCELPIFSDLRFLPNGCQYYKQEKIYGHDTVLCSCLDCLNINKEQPPISIHGVDYKSCRRCTSVNPSTTDGCIEYETEEQPLKGEGMW